MGAFRHSSMRALAPASLVVFAIVFLIVVIASVTGGDSSSSTDSGSTSITQERQGTRAKHKRAATRPKAPRGYYVVRAGDNLFTIATKTGVSIEVLRQLNPSLDPQGLVTGERVRLPTAGTTGASGATGSTGAVGPG